MAGFYRFGSPEHFQELDRQVNAAAAPQVVSGAINQQQLNEMRSTAQRRAQKKVSRFYGLNNKYDGKGRLRA